VDALFDGRFLPSELLDDYANKLLDYAIDHDRTRRAVRRLDGPAVHHPALYWTIWQTVEFLDSTEYAAR
jgi:hypothetical protein